MSSRVGEVTAIELLHMPDNGMRRELVAGELREMKLSGQEHGVITMHFSTPLHDFVKTHDLGAVLAAGTGFLLASHPDTVRAPDVAFVARERLSSLTKSSGYFSGAPDLAVEVISPNDSYMEVEAKVEDWLNSGCCMVVVVNPRNRTVKVYRSTTDVAILTVDDCFHGEDALTGFELPVLEIFK